MENGFGPLLVFEIPIPGTDIVIPISNTVTVTWFIMLVLGISCYLLTRNFEKIPGKVQNVIEMLVETIVNLTKETMGEDKVKFAPYVGTVLIFLAVSNTIGIFGMRPPTADVNTTMALAIITFCLIHINAVRSKGFFTHIKGLTEPMVILTPINVIGEIATPISLGFRLFGNIMGGMIIMELIYNMLAALSSMLFGPNALPVFQFVIPLPFHLYFDIFSGLLQSFIFTMLTMVNISMAME